VSVSSRENIQKLNTRRAKKVEHSESAIRPKWTNRIRPYWRSRISPSTASGMRSRFWSSSMTRFLHYALKSNCGRRRNDYDGIAIAKSPLLGALLFDNGSSDARDHCANERSGSRLLNGPACAKIRSLSVLASALHVYGRRVSGNCALLPPEESTDCHRTAHVTALWHNFLASIHGLSCFRGCNLLSDCHTVQPEISTGPIWMEDRDCALPCLNLRMC
jgi:hypothetical protein